MALTLAGSTVEGDIYLGGYAHDKDSITTVKSSQLVLREGTSVTGTIHTGGMNFDGNASAEVENALIGSMTFSVGNHTLKPESIC